MNTLKKIVMIVILTILMIFINACEETATTTEIYPDGSCKRTVVVKANSDKIFKYGFPLPTDPSWTVGKKWEKGKKNNVFGSSKTFVYTAEKVFPGVSDLNREYARTSGDPLKINVEVKLEKRFAWFFSYLTYREVYRRFFPFGSVPIEDYFSPGELEILELQLTDEEKSEATYPAETLKKMEKKFEAWYSRCIFEEFHRLVVERAGQLEGVQLTPEFVESRKEALYEAFSDDYKFLDEEPVSKMLEKYVEVLGSAGVREIREQSREAFSLLEETFRAVEDVVLDEFTNVLSMPGLITDTNAGAVTGNRVTWKFGADGLLIGDHEMWVTSRVVNWWMVGISGFVFLLVIVFLVVGALSRGRRK